MKLLEQIDRVLLEKSQKLVMYHGTSTKFLRSILKKGLIPNPKKQRWGKDMDSTRRSVQPVATLDGHVYLAKSGYFARDIAVDATKKFGGEPLIVIAQVSPNSVAVDHDDLTGPVRDAVMSVAYDRAPEDQKDAVSWLMGFIYGVETAQRIRIGKEFGKTLASYIGADNKAVLDHEVEGQGVEASLPTKILLMYMELAYRKHGNAASFNNGYIASQQDYWEPKGWDTSAPRKGEEWTSDHREKLRMEIERSEREWPRNLSQSALEEEWREAIRAVSERLGGAVGSEDSRAKSAMIDDPLNYRGSNRILAVVELGMDRLNRPAKVTVHYSAIGDDRLEKLITKQIGGPVGQEIAYAS